TEREYLKATALIELDRGDRALSILKSREDYASAFLQSEIHWRTKDWAKVIEALEPAYKELIREERMLDKTESEHLLKLAISYALVGNKKKLGHLYEDFLPFVG